MRILRFNEGLEKLTAEQSWVNVKIDEKIFYRLNRYIPALDRVVGGRYKFNMLKKIQGLSNIEKHIKGSKITLQDKISLIVILQYLKEIKNNFNASSAGFLLEGFLATLIYGILTKERSAADLISKEYRELDPVEFKANGIEGSTRGNTYQIKFYREVKNGIIKVSWEDNRRCDYYTICLKRLNGDIDVYILNGRNRDASYIGNFTQKNRVINPDIDSDENIFVKSEKNGKKYINIKTDEIKEDFKMTLKVTGIESLIESCGKKVQKSLKDVFDSLSTMHYNIDTLITGYDTSGKVKVTAEQASNNCSSNITDLKNKIDDLTKDLND